LRVVFDTNVLVSALNFPGGAPESAYRLVLEGRLELVTSKVLLTELARVLSLKLGWNDARTGEAVAQVIRLGCIADVTETVEEILDDPSDNRVLEAAADGNAELIVSGDRHLLRRIRARDRHRLSRGAADASDLTRAPTLPGTQRTNHAAAPECV
jgi:putative PIN family toxin of toxin-antitoxin system